MGAARDSDLVFARRVARLGDAAEGVAVGRRLCHALELVALVGDLGDGAACLAHVDVRLRRVRRLGFHCARIAREVDAVRVLEERERLRRRARGLEVRPVDRGLSRACGFKHRVALCKACRVEVHLLDVRDRAGLVVLALDIERVARAVCSRAALECARDVRVAVQVDRVVVRRRAFAARDGADRGIGEVYGVVRGFACCGFAADDVCREVLFNRDFVGCRLAARDIGEAAVDGARDACRAVDLDLVGDAVLLLIGCSRRACTGRPAAVDVRMVVRRNGNLVLRRRVAEFGAAAPGVCAVGRLGVFALDTLEGIALVGDLVAVRLEGGFRRVACLCARVHAVGDRDAIAVLDERAAAVRRAADVEQAEAGERGSRRVRQVQ